MTTNHSQILFLLRLVDTIDMLSKQLKEDAENTLKYQTSASTTPSATNATAAKQNKDNNNNLRSESETGDESDESNNGLSANISIVINKLEVELEVNDHAKEEYTKQTENLSAQTQTNAPNHSPSSYSSPDVKSNLSLNLNATKTNSNPIQHQDDTKSMSSLDQARPGLVIKDPMLHDIKKDDFDLISKQLDNEFMTGYLKFIYGLSAENPNLRHCFISVNNNGNMYNGDETPVLVSPQERTSTSVSFSSNGSVSLTSSMHKSVSNSSSTGITNSSSSTTANPLNVFKSNNTTKKDVSPTQSEVIDADFYDDNDSAIINFTEHYDTASLASFSADILNPASLLGKHK